MGKENYSSPYREVGIETPGRRAAVARGHSWDGRFICRRCGKYRSQVDGAQCK